jgi:peptide chain release factor 1
MATSIEVRPGEGGDDAVVFASELVAAFCAHARRTGINPALTAGAGRTTTITFDAPAERLQLGRFAGVHRIQRIPANDRAGRRHTSTASVVVLGDEPGPRPPLDPADIDVEVFRGSGPGGQHRNKTETCARLTHRPTGTVVVATASRSQHRNIADARAELARRLEADLSAETGRARNGARRSQVAGAGRPVKAWTWNDQRSEVVDHDTGQRWPMRAFLRGRFDKAKAA